MQDILTALVELLTISTIVAMLLDYSLRLRLTAPAQCSSQKPTTPDKSVTPGEPEGEPDSPTTKDSEQLPQPDPWMLPIDVRALPQTLPQTAIALDGTVPLSIAPLKLLPPSRSSTQLTQINYDSMTIRGLKKLASVARISRYNVMDRQQLIQALSA